MKKCVKLNFSLNLFSCGCYFFPNNYYAAVDSELRDYLLNNLNKFKTQFA